MTRKSVDLPQPFGPISATIPPPGITRSTPSRTASGGAVTRREREISARRRIAPDPGREVPGNRGHDGPFERPKDRRGCGVQRP